MLTDDPGIVVRNHWEINVSFNSAVSDVKEFEAPLIDINYGYREQTQLKIEMPFDWTETAKSTFAKRTGSPLIGVKQRFVDGSKNFISVATYPQWLIPVHADDATELKIPLELEKTIGRFLIGEEVGTFVSAAHSPALFIGNLVGYKFSDGTEAMAEWYIVKEGNHQSAQRFFNAGLRHTLSKKYILLVSAGTQEHRPVYEPRETFFSFTGVQILFGRAEKK